MKTYATSRSRNPLRHGILFLAVSLALFASAAAFAQDEPAPTGAAEGANAPSTGAMFSLDDSDDPDALWELTQHFSTLEIGGIYLSDDAFRFGRYSGMTDQGAYGLLNLDMLQRGPWNGNDASYLKMKVDNFGLPSRDAWIEYGVQGKFKTWIDYSQIPINRSNTAMTPFDGAGSTQLTLPSNWVASGSTAGMTNLLPDLKSFDLKTQRRRTGIGFSGVLTPRLSFSLSYKSEKKDGTKSIGAVFGNTGGNPRSVLIPEPVDYHTQQIDASITYASGKFQLEAAYYLSLFDDRNAALTWTNPYSAISGWASGVGFPGGVGQLSLPPDNQFHQFSLTAGYDLSQNTRITASAARGRMTQNDQFLPYTDIPALAASITQPLPVSSLDGRIDTTVVNFRISSRPTRDFSWNASYRYDDRDNKTPREEFVYIGGDSQFQDTSLTSSHRRFNEPYSYKDEEYKLDASYRLFGQTQLSGGIQHSKVDRTYSERERANEDSYNLGLNSEVSDRFSNHVRYTHSRRDGSTYYGNEPLHTGFSPDYAATVPGDFENLPGLRKFYQADRKRDTITWMMDYMVTDAFTLSASYNHFRDKYDRSELGLISSKANNYSLEAVYAPAADWSVYGNATMERQRADQEGRSFSNATQAVDVTRDWSVDHRDRISSYAIGWKHGSQNGRFDFGIDYLYSRTRSDLTFATGTSLTSLPLPQDVSNLKSLDANCQYKLSARTSVRLDVWYERYDATDWAADGIAPNTLANVILLGEGIPDYSVYATAVSLVYRF